MNEQVEVMSTNEILGDHRRIGAKLITPFNDKLGGINEVSWLRRGIPELLWIALLQYKHGHRGGVQLVTEIARAARNTLVDPKKSAFATMSSFSALLDDARENVTRSLRDGHMLDETQRALTPLVSWYPKCPLGFLLGDAPPARSDSNLQTIKDTISSLSHRDDRDPMMVQATAVWLMFDAGKLVVNEGLALASFPEIEKYPETELSQRVGSGVRAVSTMIIDSSEEYSTQGERWSHYFWNNGLRIDRCEFNG